MTVLGGVVVPGITNKGFLDSAALTTVNVIGSSATALTVQKDAGTDYVLQVATNGADADTGLKITGADAASGLALQVLSPGADENVTVDAKGAGTVSLNATATGAVVVGHGLTVTGANRHSGTGITGLGAAEAVAIATGVATITRSHVKLESETGTTDTLDTITLAGVTDGDLLWLVPDGDDTITLSDAGNIWLQNGNDTQVLAPACSAMLRYDGTNSGWFVEIFNAAHVAPD